jgi:Family of unknown function (DUF6194)
MQESQSGGADDGSSRHFTALDKLMPHPVYGQYHWVCVLNPSQATFETLKPLLQEAYDRAVQRYAAPLRGKRQ